jgi:uncharacterized protein (TIGR02246 family)
MKLSQQAEMEIRGILYKLVEVYKNGDVDTLLSLFAEDPDVTVIGLGPGERKIGLDAIRPHFERDFFDTSSILLEWKDFVFSGAGSVAWVSAEAKVKILSKITEVSTEIRFTAVLEKREDQWLFLQMHNSVPFALD